MSHMTLTALWRWLEAINQSIKVSLVAYRGGNFLRRVECYGVMVGETLNTS
jgi:hypothetical protein